MRTAQREPAPGSAPALAGAGLLFGLAAGLKLTNSIYLAAATLAWLAAARGGRVRSTCALAAGAAGGILVGAGPWMAHNLRLYGSPIFPFFNNVFRSPEFAPMGFRDMRWPAHGVADLVRFPLAWLHGDPRSLEHGYRDARWAVLLTLLAAALVVTLVRLVRRRSAAVAGDGWIEPTARRLLLGYTAAAYLLWLVAFGYARYLLNVELLCPLAIAAALDVLRRAGARDAAEDVGAGVAPRRRSLALLLLLLAGIVFFASLPEMERLSWQTDWFGVRTEGVDLPSDATVLMASSWPDSYVLPYLPARAHFVRIHGNLFELPGLLDGSRFARRLEDRLDGPAPLYVLVPVSFPDPYFDLGPFGRVVVSGDCGWLQTHFDRFKLCRAAFAPPPAELGAAAP